MKTWFLPLLFLVPLSAPASEDPSGPVSRMQAGLAAAAERGWPPQREELRRLINRNFDLIEITRVILGTHVNTATAAQRDRLAHALGMRMARELSRKPPPRDGVVTGIRPIGTAEWLVTTLGDAGESKPVALGWRVREREGTMRVIDMLRGGTSAVITQHAEFIAALRDRDLERVIIEFERLGDLN